MQEIAEKEQDEIRDVVMELDGEYEYSFPEDDKAVIKSTQYVRRYDEIYMSTDVVMNKLPDHVQLEEVEFMPEDSYDSTDTFAMYLYLTW